MHQERRNKNEVASPYVIMCSVYIRFLFWPQNTLEPTHPTKRGENDQREWGADN